MQLEGRLCPVVVWGEECRIVDSLVKWKTASCVPGAGCPPVQTVTPSSGAEGFSPLPSNRETLGLPL